MKTKPTTSRDLMAEVPSAKALTYATVCSGIECMSVACLGLPMRPVFFSEIEPFPCAVLKAHYPDVPNLGDMSKISVTNKTEITNGTVRIVLDRPIDILAGGTPCQDVSVAGKRAGMQEGSGTRSSLAFEFVRLARELSPRYVVWENVSGCIDSKNAPDFLAFLRALGDCGYSLAWRVLDAQYVRVDGMERAVPQRRRRVWVVGYSGADESRAAEILFEPDCVAGHTAPRRRTGEGFAYSLVGRDRVDAGLVGEPAGCEPAVARTLERRYDSSPCIDRGQNCIALDGGCLNPLDVQSKRIYLPSGSAPCLPSGGTEGMTIQPSVCIALDGDKLKPREDQRKSGNGFGINEDGAGDTLTGVDRHGVAYGMDARNTGLYGAGATGEEVSMTQDANQCKGGKCVVQCYDMTHADDPGRKVADGVSPTLQSRMGTGGNQVPLTVSTQGLDGYNQQMTGDCAPTLRLCKSDADHVPSIISTNSSRDTEPLGIGRDVFNSEANASFSPDIRVGVQPTLTARTTQGAVCARLKGEP